MFKYIIVAALTLPVVSHAGDIRCDLDGPALCAADKALDTAEFYYNKLQEAIGANESDELLCQKIGRVQGAFAALSAVTVLLPSTKEKGWPVYMEPLIGMEGFCDPEKGAAIPWMKYHDRASLKDALSTKENGSVKQQLEFVRQRLLEDMTK